MRFMFIMKGCEGQQPTPELMAAMHELAAAEVAAGRMLHDGGLFPRDAGAEVRLAGGKLIVMDGPFAETKEVVGGYAVFELPDLEAAKESARKFLELQARHMPGLEATCEIRQVAGSQVELLKAGG